MRGGFSEFFNRPFDLVLSFFIFSKKKRLRKTIKRQNYNSKRNYGNKIILDIVISDDSPEPSSPPKFSTIPLVSDDFCRCFPWFHEFPEIPSLSSDSSSSDFLNFFQYVFDSRFNNSNSLAFITPLATKFLSPKRETPAPEDHFKLNLLPYKMSGDL